METTIAATEKVCIHIVSNPLVFDFGQTPTAAWWSAWAVQQRAQQQAARTEMEKALAALAAPNTIHESAPKHENQADGGKNETGERQQEAAEPAVDAEPAQDGGKEQQQQQAIASSTQAEAPATREEPQTGQQKGPSDEQTQARRQAKQTRRQKRQEAKEEEQLLAAAVAKAKQEADDFGAKERAEEQQRKEPMHQHRHKVQKLKEAADQAAAKQAETAANLEAAATELGQAMAEIASLEPAEREEALRILAAKAPAQHGRPPPDRRGHLTRQTTAGARQSKEEDKEETKQEWKKKGKTIG